MPIIYRGNGWYIEVRKENNHEKPHFHGISSDGEISISLEGKILAGRFRDKKKQTEALTWVKERAEILESVWREANVQDL